MAKGTHAVFIYFLLLSEPPAAEKLQIMRIQKWRNGRNASSLWRVEEVFQQDNKMKVVFGRKTKASLKVYRGQNPVKKRTLV